MKPLPSPELIVVFAIFSHVIVPAGLLFWLGRTRATDRVVLGLTALLVISFLALFHMDEVYLFTLSGHLRWVWLIGCAVALVAAFKRAAVLRWRPHFKPMRSAIKLVVIAVLAITFATGLVFYRVEVASAGAYEGAPLELKFPLVHHHAFVMHGGSSLYWNHHVASPGQRYALDVVAIDPVWRRRAQGVFPKELAAYFVYGAHVVAPCSGKVAAIETKLADQTPPRADPEHTAGNHVVLHCAGNSVLLAHLQKGSVKVSLGQRVQVGQLVGFVGNSGNTSEPHLHVEAVAGLHRTMHELDRAKAVPMLFSGRFLIRGDIVDGR